VGNVAATLHRPAAEVTKQERRASALTAAINAKLTRSNGIYVDGLYANGSQVGSAAQDTNACALFYGLVPAARVATVGGYIAGLGLTAPPRTASEVVGALAIAGRFNHLVHVLTDKNHDGWAKILAKGGTFTWEVWEPSDIIGDSMSHGWGATVLVEIQRALLGVIPDSAGYSSFTVTPPPTGLDEARGTVPTPAGTIAVSWERRPTNAGFSMNLTVPPNTSATVKLPAARVSQITESGHPLSAAAGVVRVRDNGTTATLSIGSGTYHFSVGS
jgi:alpha-L-rhamnosidase